MINIKLCLFFLLLSFYSLIAANPKEQKDYKKDFIDNYQIKERVFIDIQKEIFLAGEKMYFTAYCYDHSLEIRTGLSSIVYIEFFDQDNKPLQQIKVHIKNGMAAGFLEIPKKAATDYYYIRAYTNFMKNEGSEVFFQKRIKVINPFFNYLAQSIEKELIPDSVKIGIFPESGNLVNGLAEMVAVRITGAEGYYSYFTASITDQNNNVILDSIKIDKYGFGYFELLPDIKHEYIFKASIGKQNYTSYLPEVKPYGLTLSVVKTDVESITVELGNNHFNNYPLDLIFEKNGITNTVRTNITSDDRKIHLPLNKLPKGIGMLHLQNSYGVNILSRVIYVPLQKTNAVEIINNKQYGTREEINIQIIPLNESLPPENIYMNLWVYFSTDSSDNREANPYYNERLKSDIKSLLNIGNYDIIEELIQNKSELNRLLLCASEKRESTSFKQSMKYLPEIYGDIISGSISLKNQTSPVEDKMVYLSFLDSISYLKIASSDSAGRFAFTLTQNPPCSDIIISIEDSSQNYSVELDPEFYPYFSPISKNVYIPNTSDKEKIRQAKINLQVEDFFAEKASFETQKEISYDFFGVPTSKYFFHDYIDLPNLDEFIYEIVDGLKVKKQKQTFEFRITTLDNIIFRDKPLFLFDGIPYFDNLGEILKLKPAELKSISLIEQQYFFDRYMFMGVVDIKSNKGDFSLLNWPESAGSFKYECVQNSKKHIEVKYIADDTKNLHTPLYSNILFWNSNIKFDNAGETSISFYTGDLKGEYIIQGTCYSESGSIEYFTSRFEVK